LKLYTKKFKADRLQAEGERLTRELERTNLEISKMNEELHALRERWKERGKQNNVERVLGVSCR